MRVLRVSFGVAAAVLVMMGGAHSAKSQEPPISKTYILSQAICLPPPTPPPSVTGSPPPAPSPAPGTCIAQTVPLGAAIQVQLPGTPSRWTVVRLSNVEGDGPDPNVIPNPLRIAGTSEIYIFSFRATTAGPAAIIFQESPSFIASRSNGIFTYTLTVQR